MDGEDLRGMLLNEFAALTIKIKEAVQTEAVKLLQVELEEFDKRKNSVIESERKLAKWKVALEEESKSFACMGAVLNAGQLDLARERSQIDTEKQDLAKEKEQIVLVKTDLARKQNKLSSEKEDLAREKSRILSLKEGLAEEKSRISSEKEDLAKEKSKIWLEKENLAIKESKIASENESLAKEKNKIWLEMENLAIKESKIASEKESLAKERKEIAKARQAVFELRFKYDNLLEKHQSMLTTLEEKERKLNRKGVELEEKRDALTAREKENSAKEQKLAQERQQWQTLMRSGAEDLGRRVGRDGMIALVEETSPLDEFSSRGWMRFDNFFADLYRLRTILNVSEETVSAIKRLIEHMQERKKIVDGVIKLDKDATFITITIGQAGADRLVYPVVGGGSPHGLDSTLRTLYNSLLNKARQSSEAATVEVNNDDDSDCNQETRFLSFS